MQKKGTQPLVRTDSPHSSTSTEDKPTLAIICRARALVDSYPNPYDKEQLLYKVDIFFLFITYFLKEKTETVTKKNLLFFGIKERRCNRSIINECIWCVAGSLSRTSRKF